MSRVGASPSIQAKRAAFRALHDSGCFLLPNPWDVGSARLLEQLGFSALASSSAAFAWTTGRADYRVTLEDVLSHLRLLSGAVNVPVNADFESGFAREPEGVARNVGRAIETGIAGLSIEDRDLQDATRLYEPVLAIERIRAARAEIDRSASGVVLVARSEGLLLDPGALTPAIDRLVAFADAGADCLYAPGVREEQHIATMVRAVAPKPLNVLALNPTLSLPALAALGVRRVSVGGSLARVLWGALRATALQLSSGSFAGLASGMLGSELNTIFEAFE